MDDFYTELDLHEMNELQRDEFDWNEEEDDENNDENVCEDDEDYKWGHGLDSWSLTFHDFCREA